MRGNIPTEKPQVRAYIYSFLDYLTFCHGAFIEIAVKDWLYEKEQRLAWKEKAKEPIKEKD